MEFTVKTKIDMSGFKKIEKTCEALDHNAAISGVLDADQFTLSEAKLNEEGGASFYRDGPFAGEKVEVPSRPFISEGAKLRIDHAFSKATSILKSDFTPSGVKRALELLGTEAAEGQMNALEYNGAGIAGWLPNNEERTVATKGFDRPLWSRRGETFPITHKVIEK